jgi:molybdopterin-guanine dinucleotide biosynthesis protein A
MRETSSVDESRGVSGIVLAGGSSSRLGRNKALIAVQGQPLIRRVTDRLCPVVDEVLLVTNTPGLYAFLDLPMVGDIYPGVGALGGLHAGLAAMHSPYGLVVGCDMPFLNADLLDYLISLRDGYEVVIPRVGSFYEPLHAVYSARCLPLIERQIRAGQRRVLGACMGARVRYVDRAEIARYDAQQLSFFNINSPQDLERTEQLLKRDSP